MTTGPLEYAPSARSRPRRRWRWGVVAVAAVLLPFVPWRGVTVREDRRVDAVTGTTSWTTVWPFGITGGSRFDVSPLELRLKRSEIPWTPAWRGVHSTHRNLCGRAVGYECGSSQPINTLRPVSEAFAAASTDEELTEFVRRMGSGSEAEQQAAVDAAVEKAIHWREAGRRGN